MLGWLQTSRSIHTWVGSFRATSSRLGASSKSNKCNPPATMRSSALGIRNQLEPLSNHFWKLNLTWIWEEIKRESLGELGILQWRWERESRRCTGLFEWELRRESRWEEGDEVYIPLSQRSQISRGSVVAYLRHCLCHTRQCRACQAAQDKTVENLLLWLNVWGFIWWKCEHLVAHLSLCIASPL